MCDVHGGGAHVAAALPQRHFQTLVASMPQPCRLALWTRPQLYICADGVCTWLSIEHAGGYGVARHYYQRERQSLTAPISGFNERQTRGLLCDGGTSADFNQLYDVCRQAGLTFDLPLGELTDEMSLACQHALETACEDKTRDWYYHEPEAVVVGARVLQMTTRAAIILTPQGTMVFPERRQPPESQRYVPPPRD
jgi:hypothetical protein